VFEAAQNGGPRAVLGLLSLGLGFLFSVGLLLRALLLLLRKGH